MIVKNSNCGMGRSMPSFLLRTRSPGFSRSLAELAQAEAARMWPVGMNRAQRRKQRFSGKGHRFSRRERW